MANDRFGDPLPAGAIARMGSMRTRQPASFAAVVFSADGKSVAAGGQDNTVRLWEATTSKETGQFGVHEGNRVTAIAMTIDGKMVVTGTKSGALSYWAVDTGMEMNEGIGHQGEIRALAFSSDGKTLLSASADNTIRSWDPTTGQQIQQFSGQMGDLETVAFSADRKSFAFGSWESTIRCCDVASFKEISQFRGPRTGTKSLAFSPDGRNLASGSSTEGISIWELATGKERIQYQGPKEGTLSLAYSPDGKMLASAGGDTTILIWDLTGRAFDKRAPAAVSPAQLEPFWNNLASDDAALAFEAINALGGSAKISVPFLKDRLRFVAPLDPIRLARLMTDLNNSQFATRERATEELEKLGALVEPALVKAQQGPPPPPLEVRRRLEKLLEKIKGPRMSPDTLQAVRALEALEASATPEAKQLLETIARSTPATRLVNDAKDILARITKR